MGTIVLPSVTVRPRACVDLRRCMYCEQWKQHKVQNTPLIWCKRHMTNSSHVIGHFLHMLHLLRCVHNVHCIACIQLETVLNYAFCNSLYSLSVSLLYVNTLLKSHVLKHAIHTYIIPKYNLWSSASQYPISSTTAEHLQTVISHTCGNDTH